MRYEPETSGAVLDTATGLRFWMATHLEAIKRAERMNAEHEDYERWLAQHIAALE